MAKVLRTEHAGAKHGAGAYWGNKQEAKRESRKARRAAGKKEGNANANL